MADSSYITEPLTSGKVVVSTTIGDLDIELWPNEGPRSSRCFLQNCLDNKYDGATLFIGNGFAAVTPERNVPVPFSRPEVHSRLRFSRRGLIALRLDDQRVSQGDFVITLTATPWLKGTEHPILGTVMGDTIYNLHKLTTMEHDDGRPVIPVHVRSTKILNNPFPDMVKSVSDLPEPVVEKKRVRGVSAAALLSFDDGDDTFVINKKPKLDEKKEKKHKKEKKEKRRDWNDYNDVSAPVSSNAPGDRHEANSRDSVTHSSEVSVKNVKDSGFSVTTLPSAALASSENQPPKKSLLGSLSAGFKRRGEGGRGREADTLKKLSAFKSKVKQNSEVVDTTSKDLTTVQSDVNIGTYLNLDDVDDEGGDWKSHRFVVPKRAQDEGINDANIVIHDTKLRKTDK